MFENDIWYMIPGFNGYEINILRQVRSFKFHNVNTYGKLLKTYKDKKGHYYVYLSDNNNKRQKMYVEDLWVLVATTKDKYARHTTDRYISSRNKFVAKEPVTIKIVQYNDMTPLDIINKINGTDDNIIKIPVIRRL